MAASPFARLHQRLNSAVERALSDTVGVFQGGEPFGAQAASSAAITASFSVAHTPGLVEGSELVLGGVVHLVSGPVQPDESGWVTVSVYPKP